MRRLILKESPQSFEIGGVQFKCWSAGQFQRDLAETNARILARRLNDASELANDLALPAGMVAKIVGGALEMAEAGDERGADEQLAGYGMHLYAVELAMICVDSWCGLEVDGVEVSPQPTRQYISALFLDNVTPGSPVTFASAFIAKVHGLSALEDSEGNGFAAGLNEFSGPAAKPVATVENSATPAQAAD